MITSLNEELDIIRVSPVGAFIFVDISPKEINSTLKTYTGKVVHYTLSEDDYPTYNYGSKRVESCKCITSLVLDCSEESESKTITIDICDIRGIKRYSEEAFEEISSSEIKEWK